MRARVRARSEWLLRARRRSGSKRLMAQQRPARRGGRRRVRKNIPVGVAHIKSSFNNTIVTLTDREGNVLAWESAGGAGFIGCGEIPPLAALGTAEARCRTGG